MLKLIAIVSVLAASINAAPTSIEPTKLFPRTDYTPFKGDGSTKDGWPSMHDWHTWDHLWAINSEVMKTSCSFHPWGANDSPEEIEHIRQAIRNIAGANKIDDRFVLAIMMEESQGCVRVTSTTSHDGVFNPGLMQSHSGAGNCINKNPCPASEINLMINDGVHGTASGPGLVGTIASTGESGAQAYYAGARVYNSGRFDRSDLSVDFGSNTPDYVSHVANRLLGWHN